MTHRKPDWDQRLNDFLAKHAGKPHEWGKHDCVTFVDGAHRAMTGRPLILPAVRGTWHDEVTANAAIVKAAKSVGAKRETLSALVDQLLPWVTRSMAHRGDIILTSDGNLAVCFGAVALAVGDPLTPGLIRIERADWRRAWHVGDRS